MDETSEKYNARLVGGLLKTYGCHRIVIAPGSRNAPIMEAVAQDEDYQLFSVPDERAAAFTALGMALEEGQPAAVVCTSGSAAANFLPAVTEAYYQRVPLLVITADRPLEWLDQGAGQTIAQQGIYGRHVRAEVSLLREPQDELARQYNQRKVNEVLQAVNRGPVHINIPFSEPLYTHFSRDEKEEFKRVQLSATQNILPAASLKELCYEWRESPRIWLLAGQMSPDSARDEALLKLQNASSYLLWSESLSNLEKTPQIGTIDRMINSLTEADRERLQPDLLITIGGEVVSKMVKKYLRSYPPRYHWHVDPEGNLKDTFGCLSRVIPMEARPWAEQLAEVVDHHPPEWRDEILKMDHQRSERHRQYLQEAGHSDLTVIESLLQYIPPQSALHCANSASVRYLQLMDRPRGLCHYGNRGTSGIDGCTSTAVGHAQATDRIVTLVTGDVAFLYDAAAFWNDRLPSNLRIVVLNNNGGNIFRIIAGPRTWEHFERLQETYHEHDLSGLGQAYGVAYRRKEEGESTGKLMQWLYRQEKTTVLEIPTPRLDNPTVLGRYFKALSAVNP